VWAVEQDHERPELLVVGAVRGAHMGVDAVTPPG
jgi:hypothetical protein